MKIIGVTEIKCFLVETDEKEFMDYTRYGKDNWSVQMGQSDEPLYCCEKIEELFQENMKGEKENKIKILKQIQKRNIEFMSR